MPEDTARELRINLISVKDHSKYFSGGGVWVGSSPGWEGSLGSQALLRSALGGALWYRLLGLESPHTRQGKAEPGPCGAASVPEAGRGGGCTLAWACMPHLGSWLGFRSGLHKLPEGREGLDVWAIFIFWVWSKLNGFLCSARQRQP